MRTTTREGQTPDQSFVETTEGDAPSSVEISTNAKGHAQRAIKLYYPSVRELKATVKQDIIDIDTAVCEALAERHIPLAGGENGSTK